MKTKSRNLNEWGLYNHLGSHMSASQAEIKSAYRKKVKTCHPDLHPDDQNKEEEFKMIQDVYDILGDPRMRAEYDILLKEERNRRKRRGSSRTYTSPVEEPYRKYRSTGVRAQAEAKARETKREPTREELLETLEQGYDLQKQTNDLQKLAEISFLIDTVIRLLDISEFGFTLVKPTRDRKSFVYRINKWYDKLSPSEAFGSITSIYLALGAGMIVLSQVSALAPFFKPSLGLMPIVTLIGLAILRVKYTGA